MPRRKQDPPAGMAETGGIQAVEAKPKKRSKDQPVEAIVLIPLTYNDGSAIALEKINAIQDQIFLLFEGWTHEGTVTGAYRMSSGEKRVEESMKLSIVLKAADIPTLEKMAGEWASEL